MSSCWRCKAARYLLLLLASHSLAFTVGMFAADKCGAIGEDCITIVVDSHDMLHEKDGRVSRNEY